MHCLLHALLTTRLLLLQGIERVQLEDVRVRSSLEPRHPRPDRLPLGHLETRARYPGPLGSSVPLTGELSTRIHGPPLTHAPARVQDQLVGSDDRNNYNELQVNICGVLTVRHPLKVGSAAGETR